jgi:hypothetical protein
VYEPLLPGVFGYWFDVIGVKWIGVSLFFSKLFSFLRGIEETDNVGFLEDGIVAEDIVLFHGDSSFGSRMPA